MGKRLLLYCETTHGTYTLAEEGAPHREVFTDLSDALAYASRFVYEETEILVFNEVGKLIIETTITPHSQRRTAESW
jgi:hypothetical protein